MRDEVIKQIAITLGMGGTNVSKAAKDIILAELQNYNEIDIVTALQRCRREVTGNVSFAHIHQRIPGARPSANAAWSTLPRSERESVVWTKETALAYGQISNLLSTGDETGARLAFRDIYEGLVREAEDRNEPVEWEFSGGTSALEREQVLNRAVKNGRIPLAQAKRIMPELGIPNTPADITPLLPEGQKKGLAHAFPSDSLAPKKNSSTEEIPQKKYVNKRVQEIHDWIELCKKNAGGMWWDPTSPNGKRWIEEQKRKNKTGQ